MSKLPSNRRVLTPSRPPENVRVEKEPAWDPDLLFRRLRLAGRVLVGVLIVAAGVFAAVHARRYVTHSPRFSLKDLRIEGGKHRTKEQLAATAGLALGQNVVELDLEAIKARLEKDPWIEKATITRKLPSTITVDVWEREAGAILALSSGTFLATPQGEVFKRVELEDPGDLPVFTGITDADATADREAVAQIVRRGLDLAAEIERVGLFGGRVQELFVDHDGGLTAAVGKQKPVRLVFGKTNYRAKTRTGARIEAELARRGARATVVFLDDDVHPDRIVVRLVSALPPAQVTVDEAPAKAPPAKPVAKAGKHPKGGAP